MFFRFIFLFINIFTFASAKEYFICTSNHTVELLTNQIWYFKLPYKYDNNITVCQITFICKDATESRLQIQTFQYDRSIDKIVLNTSRYTFVKSNENDSDFTRWAMFDDWNNDCESGNMVKPFQFTDETQKFTLKSNYNINETRKHPCLWQFTAPSNFGFKFIITNLTLSNFADLKIENTTEVLKTQHNVELYFPYYNSDNYLKINLSLSKIQDLKELEFSAYVTVVSKEWKEVEINCTKSIPPKKPGGANYLDENIIDGAGVSNYPNNARCKYDMFLPPNTDLIVTPILKNLERNVDYVQYRIGNKNVTLTKKIVITGTPVRRNVSFEFISDGSVSGDAFNIRFAFKPCHCAHSPITVKCKKSQKLNIMDAKDVTFGPTYTDNYDRYPNNYYCADLLCNLTITLEKECPNKFIEMRFDLSAEQQLSDTFNMHINNDTAFQISHFYDGKPYSEKNTYVFFLSPVVINTLAINSQTVDPSKSLLISLTSVEALPVLSFSLTLNITLPDYFIYFDRENITLLSVELSYDMDANGYTLEIYGDVRYISIYEDETMTRVLKKKQCKTSDLYSQCIWTPNKVVIYRHTTNNMYLFFHAAKRDTNNCLFNNYVFDLDYFWHQEKSKSLSAISSAKGSCKIYLFFGDDIYLDLLTTAKDNNNVIVYGSKPDKVLFQFNKTTAKYWQQVFHLDAFLIMEIPPKTSLFMTIDHDRESMLIDKYPFKTAFIFPMSEYFFGKSYNFSYVYEVKNYNVLLTVAKCNISSNYVVFLGFPNETIVSVEASKSFNIPAGTSFGFYFNSTASLTERTWPPDVLFYIETIDGDFESFSTTPLTAATETVYMEKPNCSHRFNCFTFYFLIALFLQKIFK